MAAAHYPNVSKPWLDLSTGISPWAYPVGGVARTAWQTLPDPDELGRLESAAALALDVDDPGQVVAVPGSDMAIRLVARLLGKKRVGLIEPIYSGHHAAWPDAAPATLETATKFDLLVCANPNNPDGRIIHRQSLRNCKTPRVIDEAFADAVPQSSVLPFRQGAIVLRSFGKFYGLAGIRLGFVIANRPFAKQLRALLGDWPVSGPAIDIATKAYGDIAWQERQRDRLEVASQRLSTLLSDTGLERVGGTPLFQLAAHPDAKSLFDHLAQAGILVRPFANNPGWLRFGIPGTDAAFDRLADTLVDWTSS